LVLRQVKVSAYCTQYDLPVSDPMVGCGHCHEVHWRDTVSGQRADD
jgi:hypothetical protein